MTNLTPVELHAGYWIKREDLHRSPTGVNGAKYRAAQHLAERAALLGSHTIVSAASVLSPQSAISATVAAEYGLKCMIIVGGTTPEKALRHQSIEIARDLGASIHAIKVGYNPALQSAAFRAADAPGVWRMPYGITTPVEASLRAVEDFVRVGAPQTANLPDDVRTLVLPLGSGNTACGVLYGLHDARPADLRLVVTLGIGPARVDWVRDRLRSLGRTMAPHGIRHEHIQLSPVWATYGDKMPYKHVEIVMHPTYEGKCWRYLQATRHAWWKPDDHTAFWVVGGPLLA